MNNNYSFISAKDRAQMIAKELGDKVTLEPHDDEYDRVVFTNVNNLDLLLLFYAGMAYRHSISSGTLSY
jgi:hypothetical protein